MNDLKVVFMGTPDFAKTSLQALYDSRINVAAVFTQPDKPKNRGMKMTMCPVKELAASKDTPVFQPVSMKTGEARAVLEEICPDIIAVVAYGKLLPKDILDIPRLGCINIHGSVLPKYRGAAPIQWTVLNGENTAGVTAMYMGEKLDAGDIISVRTTKVLPEETAGELFDRLAPIGGKLLCDTIAEIAAGTAGRTPQIESEATYAPPLTKEMCPIDWHCSAEEIINKIRGLSPWPVATMEISGIKFKVFRAAKHSTEVFHTPGTVVSAGKEGIVVACGDGCIAVTELQVPGGKRMNAADYLRGHPLCL